MLRRAGGPTAAKEEHQRGASIGCLPILWFDDKETYGVGHTVAVNECFRPLEFSGSDLDRGDRDVDESEHHRKPETGASEE
jgi:hypothetical protein